MELKEYLEELYTLRTAGEHLKDIKTYHRHIGPEKALTATYQDVVNYVGHLREQGLHPRTINKMLYGPKAWYRWLLKEGKREDHPCRFLGLKDAKNPEIQLQDLFAPAELEKLLERKERYQSMKARNQVMTGLMVYQGLRQKEFVNLLVEDVDLEEGTVYVRQTPGTKDRTIRLKPCQIMPFYKYINEERPGLLKKATDKLLLNYRGKPITIAEPKYLINTFKYLFPKKNLTVNTVRQSVIANLLKEGKDIRAVQVFAGHMRASTTEKYKQTAVEELKKAVVKYHPMNEMSDE